MSLFTNKIYKWYGENKRDLPWRETVDPYKIWISEIILQQTRVEQGKTYYLEFIQTFPTVEKLASAEEDKVLKLWQGLGYYSRARNLHETARYIHTKLNGEFPSKYEQLIQLKGIGPYTAAAIASIAFNEPISVVDGNVYRVLARYFGIFTPIDTNTGEKEFMQVAEELISSEDPGKHNQAIMEFGALQCIPKSPDCNACTLAETCYAYLNIQVNKLPIKIKQTKQHKRYFYYYYFDMGNFTFLQKRVDNDIWKNLYQFPLMESNSEMNELVLIQKDKIPFLNCDEINVNNISPVKKHVLSHQTIYARIIHIEIKNESCLKSDFIKVNKKDISKFAVPRLIEYFINDLKLTL